MRKFKSFFEKIFSIPRISLPEIKLPEIKLPVPKFPSLPLYTFIKFLKLKGMVLLNIILWTPRKIGWILRQIMYGITATPGAVARSPMKTFRKMKLWRDWILEKADYLETESAKWKRTFQIVKSPYSLLLKMGFSPQYAIGLLAVGTTTVTGAVAVEAMKPPSFAAGDPGVYNAPLDSPIFSSDEFNTLRLDLGTTAIGNVTIKDITVGSAYTGSALPSGQTSVVIVGGITASTPTWLEVGHVTIDRWRCDALTLSNIEVHELIVKGNASDGQSLGPIAGTPRDRAIGGGNRAQDMLTSGGYYDQVKITAPSSGVNGKIDRLVLSNFYTKGGPCVLDRIKAGTLEILLNEIGVGNGFATKEFTILPSVVWGTYVNEDNVETTISSPVVAPGP
tara:strand:- start:100 stop:1275 length:1176 start_codon:yes stop_codon:yes gene_type:complete